MLQRLDLPANTARHAVPHLVEHLQLCPGLDEREEHAELSTIKLLKEAAEHVVVVEEVLAFFAPNGREGSLQLDELAVEHSQQLLPWLRRLEPGATLNDLQPLLNVKLHLQRSEYLPYNILVDNGVAAIEEALCNAHKVRIGDRTLLQKELRHTLVPVMNALVV